MKDSNTNSLAALVDDLGKLRAQMADLKAAETAIRDELIERGHKYDLKSIDGLLFRATVVDSNRTNIDWKSIAEKLKPSRQLIAAHTRKSTVTSVRMSARSAS